jgi:virginiamycin B lyase
VIVDVKEWNVPTPNSHSHDPAVAPDGSLWYTGQMSNTLGHLDLKTGKIQEFRLKTPDSGPHGLVADHDSKIWFTANFKGYIGKLDPRTGQVAEYALPDKDAADPHTPVFDQKGMLWFTVQQGNGVGRLDPHNGTRYSLVGSNTDRGIEAALFLQVFDASWESRCRETEHLVEFPTFAKPL